MILLSDLHSNIQKFEELETIDMLIMFGLLTQFEAHKSKSFGDLTVNELNAFFDTFFEEFEK
jgi:hypothetical protein